MGQIHQNQYRQGGAQGPTHLSEGFQSKEAQVKAQQPRRSRIAVLPALIEPPKRADVEAEEKHDPKREWELVEGTPMQSLEKVRIGNKSATDNSPAWYAFEQGKRCSVPRAVARHLVEKGIFPDNPDYY
jgi:hypothetical protein